MHTLTFSVEELEIIQRALEDYTYECDDAEQHFDDPEDRKRLKDQADEAWNLYMSIGAILRHPSTQTRS